MATVDDCLDWMRKFISLPDKFAFNNLSSNRDALTLPAGSYLNFTVKGTADVLITDKHFVGDTMAVTNAEVVFELKKRVSPNNHKQAIVQTVISNILATQPVMIVLTNLKKTWFFYWLEEKKICRLDCLVLKRAITIVESALTDGAPRHAGKSDAPPFAKRVLMDVAIGREPRGEEKSL